MARRSGRPSSPVWQTWVAAGVYLPSQSGSQGDRRVSARWQPWLHSPSRSHRVQPLGRRLPGGRPRHPRGAASPPQYCDHRSRRALRDDPLLQGLPEEGHQADHRVRGLCGSADAIRPGGEGGLGPATSPPAGGERGRLPELDGAGDGQQPRRVLLQAAGGSGACGAVRGGTDRAERLPVGGDSGLDPTGAGGGGAEAGGALPGPVRAGEVLPGASGLGDRRAEAGECGADSAGEGGRGRAGGDERRALHAAGGCEDARRAAVRADELDGGPARPAAVWERSVLLQDAGGDGGAVCGVSGGAEGDGGDRRAVHGGAGVWEDGAAGLCGSGGARCGLVSEGAVPRRPSDSVSRLAGVGAREAGVRAWDHPGQRAFGVHPHYMGLDSIRQGAGDSGGAGARVGAGKRDSLSAGYHGDRSDCAGDSVRAVHQPGADLDAGRGYGFRGHAAG